MGLLLARASRNSCSLALLLAMACAVAARAAAEDGVPAGISKVVAEVDAGRFREAERDIAAGLANPRLEAGQTQAFAFQRERMRRIRLDFPLAVADVQDRLRKLVPDLTPGDIPRWDAANLLEHQDIDGKRWYFARAISNLFLLSSEAAARRQPPLVSTSGPMETPNRHHREVIDEALASGHSSVTPRHIQVTYSLTVNADAVPAGETVRAWLPFPRELSGQQDAIRLVASVPAGAKLAPADALQRTAYLEQPARAGSKTAFSITYEVTTYGQYHPIDPDRVSTGPLAPELAPYTGERAPHIVFTDAMRLFSLGVVGDEKNPYRIAQKLFAAVDRTPWAGAREYSTISNISDYALHAGHADCGQQTLLLMTLLRLNGIPTRWQSGWIFSDGDYNDMHDWGWLYLAPYGWVPMDVTFGRFDTGDPALDWFYLGGLDAYRIAFNDDFSQELVPAKQHFRSETVDSQRGEVEWKGGNLYFDQWDYTFKWKLLPDLGIRQ